MSFQLESWDTGEIVHINVHTAFRFKHGQVLSPDGHWQEIKASICEVPSDGSWKMSGQWHLLQNMRTSAEFITIIVGECFTKRDHHLELGWFGKYHKLPRGYCIISFFFWIIAYCMLLLFFFSGGRGILWSQWVIWPSGCGPKK